MNREDIIRAMRSACDKDKVDAWINDFWTITQDELERFVALVAAASEEQWKHAVINELVCCHIYNASHDSDPRKALHDAISWNVQVALDPQVSSDAQALIDRGAAAEREACAMVAEEATASWTQHIYNDACMHIAAAIRARGKLK